MSSWDEDEVLTDFDKQDAGAALWALYIAACGTPLALLVLWCWGVL